MKALPWRTVQFGDNTGRFTREQLDHAVRSVMERRQGAAAGRPLMVRENRPPFGTPLPPGEPAGVSVPGPSPASGNGGRAGDA